MGDKSSIEWTDATWNPTVGCSVLSPGCTNCYAMKMAHRIEAMQAALGNASHYAGLTMKTKAGAVWTGKMALALEAILPLPLRWKRPRRIFVNSMSDLFHEALPDESIDKVFAVMALAPQHTFQVLTKRSARMRKYLVAVDLRRLAHAHAPGTLKMSRHEIQSRLLQYQAEARRDLYHAPDPTYSLSVEDQARADERIPDLLATPAAKRFLSCEPLLGAVDLTTIDHTAAPGFFGDALRWHHRGKCREDEGLVYRGIDWVIAGGESGPNSRPMHPDWARSHPKCPL